MSSLNSFLNGFFCLNRDLRTVSIIIEKDDGAVRQDVCFFPEEGKPIQKEAVLHLSAKEWKKLKKRCREFWLEARKTVKERDAFRKKRESIKIEKNFTE